MRRTLAVLLASAVVGCGGADPLAFDLQSQVAWVQGPDAEARLRATADRAARFWGARGAEDLDGWIVVVQDGVVHCGDSVQVGCAEFWPFRRMTISALAGEGWHPSCAEQTLLAHEIGHAILYDADHTDRRWALLPAWQQADEAAFPDCL